MTLRIALYWSFRSPYSYLATGRIAAWAHEYDLGVDVCPVYPLAIRTPDFFTKVHPLWPMYVLRDTTRIAEMLGIPFGWPRPDPIVQDYATREVAAEQPHIHRLTRLGVAAAERGRGLAFIDEVSRIIWSGQVEGWDRGTHLADATARAGLDLREIDAAIAADPDAHERRIEANQAAHAAAGHWGVPTMVFESEPFFGQDRLDVLKWRLDQRGLRRRA